MQKIYILIISLFSFLYFAVSPAYAQQISMGIVPSQQEIIIKPGKTVAIPYVIKNFGDPVNFKLKVIKLSSKDVHGNMSVSEITNDDLIFSVENEEPQFNTPFLLRTNEIQNIQLSIQVPENMPEKSYVYAFIAESDPTITQEGSSKIALKGSVASPLYITVSTTEETEKDTKLHSFKLFPSYQFSLFGEDFNVIESNQPIVADLIVENNGSFFDKTEALITFGKPNEQTTTYKSQLTRVLPYSKKLLQVEGTDICKKIKQTKQLCDDHTLVLEGKSIGNYMLKVNSHNQAQVIRFIVFPVKYMVYFFSLLAITIFILLLTKYIKKM